MNNNLTQVIEHLLLCKQSGKKPDPLIVKEAKQQSVSLYDIAEEMLNIVNDIISYADTIQAVDEVRLLTVIKALPDDIQQKIKQKFEEEEDDLLTQPTKGEKQ